METTMGKATSKTTQSPAPHAADIHDLIRVQGARENNLKDVSVEIPKRRLTVFTGVSGSGKSSLVFGTIAAESQRMINETYSAFVQGFMPTLARPDVDVLEGLTTAIIVDQERMGSDPRSTVGTATDANAMLRILFSRLGKPHIGSPQAFSFNVASVSGAGAVTIEQAAANQGREARRSASLGGMCSALRGQRPVTDIDLTQLYDDNKSLNEGALTIPGYSMEGWYGRIFPAAASSTRTSRSTSTPRRSCTTCSTRSRPRSRSTASTSPTQGLIPKIQKSMLSKDVDAMQPHIRAFVERAVTFTTCPECDGTRLQRGGPVVEDQRHQHRRRLRDADQRPGRAGCAASSEPSVAPLLGRAAATPSTRSSRSGSATSASTGRPARCRAARRSAPR